MPDIVSGLNRIGQKSIKMGLADRLAKKFGAGMASTLPGFSTLANWMALC
jgi:hypothetical protein